MRQIINLYETTLRELGGNDTHPPGAEFDDAEEPTSFVVGLYSAEGGGDAWGDDFETLAAAEQALPMIMKETGWAVRYEITAWEGNTQTRVKSGTRQEILRFMTKGGTTLYHHGDWRWRDSLDPAEANLSFDADDDNTPLNDRGQRIAGRFI